MTLTPQDQQAIVAAHNAYRSEPAINAPALQWSSELAAGAQSWADYLATTLHKLEHSTSDARGGAGENIAQAPAEGFTLAQMVDFWGKTEIGGSSEQGTFKPGIFPDTSKTGDWRDAGHYTQVIWGDTTSVGCGIASDSENSYLVCRYSPAGNMEGVQVPRLVPTVLGTWNSEYGPVTYQGSNQQITGYWVQGPNKRGQITSGTFDPATRKLKFDYFMDWGNQNGVADLTLSPDGRQLQGTWSQQNGSGTWTMTHE